jgi:hypothetical protein
MAQAEEKIVRARGLVPALKFPDTRLRIAENETIGGQILQRKLDFWADAPELCTAVLPSLP